MSKLSQWFMSSFPVPEYLTMPAAGLDISSNSIKYLEGTYTPNGCLPQRFSEVFLPEGTIRRGEIVEKQIFIDVLRQLFKKHKRKYVFVSIPENALYLYTMQLSGNPDYNSIIQQIEFSFSEHVPISIKDAVYDFDIVSSDNMTTLISVTVAPATLIDMYVDAITSAGFLVRSIELEAYAISRAVVKHNNRSHDTEMIIDIGHNRAGIIIAKNGLPIFTNTIQSKSNDHIEIVDECKKQYTFWDTRTDNKGRRIDRVSRIELCGGGVNTKLEHVLKKQLQAQINMANVWQNLFDINNYVPDISADGSLAMATLAGLLLNNKR
jgi:Tfp pilus assembly PilM family ATPase